MERRDFLRFSTLGGLGLVLSIKSLDGLANSTNPPKKFYVYIDKDNCTGCGLCVDSVPDVFQMGDDIAEVVAVSNIVPANLLNVVKVAIEDCPTTAITMVEK